METNKLLSVPGKRVMCVLFAASLGLMASCGATKNTESGEDMESDTIMTPPMPDTAGTETPMPIDTMGQ